MPVCEPQYPQPQPPQPQPPATTGLSLEGPAADLSHEWAVRCVAFCVWLPPPGSACDRRGFLTPQRSGEGQERGGGYAPWGDCSPTFSPSRDALCL